MNPYDPPSGDASGTAAVRQRQQATPASEQELETAGERAARVAQLRQQYQSGELQVDAAELSSEIVNKHIKK